MSCDSWGNLSCALKAVAACPRGEEQLGPGITMLQRSSPGNLLETHVGGEAVPLVSLWNEAYPDFWGDCTMLNCTAELCLTPAAWR